MTDDTPAEKSAVSIATDKTVSLGHGAGGCTVEKGHSNKAAVERPSIGGQAGESSGEVDAPAGVLQEKEAAQRYAN